MSKTLDFNNVAFFSPFLPVPRPSFRPFFPLSRRARSCACLRDTGIDEEERGEKIRERERECVYKRDRRVGLAWRLKYKGGGEV